MSIELDNEYADVTLCLHIQVYSRRWFPFRSLNILQNTFVGIVWLISQGLLGSNLQRDRIKAHK